MPENIQEVFDVSTRQKAIVTCINLYNLCAFLTNRIETTLSRLKREENDCDRIKEWQTKLTKESKHSEIILTLACIAQELFDDENEVIKKDLEEDFLTIIMRLKPLLEKYLSSYIKNGGKVVIVEKPAEAFVEADTTLPDSHLLGEDYEDFADAA